MMKIINNLWGGRMNSDMSRFVASYEKEQKLRLARYFSKFS